MCAIVYQKRAFCRERLGTAHRKSWKTDTGFYRWYWAAKHALADAELMCPAKLAASHFARHNVSAFEFQWKHSPLQSTCKKEPCNAPGEKTLVCVRFWYGVKKDQFAKTGSGQIKC